MSIKFLLSRVHPHDPLATAIQDLTRTDYVHAMLLVDEATNTVSEAYWPHVRRRQLPDAELAGVDVYELDPRYVTLTDEQIAGILAYCAEAEAVKEPYSVENLFRFEVLFRKVLGEAVDNGVHCPVVCSQYMVDAALRGAGVTLLNAPSYKLAPGYVAWSPLLRLTAPLQPLANKAV